MGMGMGMGMGIDLMSQVSRWVIFRSKAEAVFVFETRHHLEHRIFTIELPVEIETMGPAEKPSMSKEET